MNEITQLTLGDLVTYFPQVILGLGGILVGIPLLKILWKTGKGLNAGARAFEENPRKTISTLGMVASLFGTPVLLFKNLDSDPGFAIGATLVGVFVAVLSGLGFRKPKDQDQDAKQNSYLGN